MSGRRPFWLLALVIPALFVTPLSAQSKRKGTQYAFLVACSGYDKTELKPLPYTVNDVEEFKKVLLESGFESSNIKVLHDKAQARRYQPEKAKILRELDLLLKGLRPEDALIVALSGHGVHFKGDKVGYFCPLDAELADKKTLIPMEGEGSIFELLKDCKAGRKLLLVNACRNDPASDLAQAAKKINLDDEDTDRVPDGVAALYSCQPGEKSYYDPDRKMGLFFLHVCNAWRGDYQEVGGRLQIEEFFEQVRLKTKADADATFGRAQVPVVKREYQGVWVLDQGNLAARAALRRGKVLLDRHQFDQAIKLFTDTIRLNPRESAAYAWRGYARIFRGRLDEALADAREAVRLNPDAPLGYAVRAYVYNWKFDRKNALEDAERAVRLDDRFLLARIVRSQVLADASNDGYLDSKHFADALSEAEEAIKIGTEPALAYSQRGFVYALRSFRLGSDQYGLALDDLTRAIELEPNFSWHYLSRGWTYYFKRDYDRAIVDFTRAIELDSKSFWPRNGRGAAYTSKREYDRAIADYNRAIELNPKYAVLYSSRGNAYYGKKDYDRAIADYSQSIELDPKNVWPYRNRADAYERLGLTEQAKADREKARQLDK